MVNQKGNIKIKSVEYELSKSDVEKIMGFSPDVICVCSGEGIFIKVSSACISMWGYKSLELCNTKLVDIVYDEDKAATLQMMDDTRSGISPTKFKNRCVHRSGSIISLTWSSAWDSEAQVMYCIGRKDADCEEEEAALKKSEEKYRNLFNSNPLPSWIYEVNTFKFLEVNTAAIKHYGYTLKEFLSMTLMDIRTEKSAAKLNFFLSQKVFHKGDSSSIWEHKKKNGQRILAEITSHAIKYDDKNARLVVVNDITQQKLAEQELIRSEHNYNALVNTIDGIVWEADARTCRYSFVSKQAEAMLGYPIAEWIDNPTFWIDHIHPDDKEWVTMYSKTCNDEKRSHTLEYRMIDVNGKVVWLQDFVSVIIENEIATYLRGIMTDISERKMKELLLQESHKRYHAIIDTSMMAFFLSNDEGDLLDTNTAACELFGYKREDLLKLKKHHIIDVNDDRFIEAFHQRKNIGKVKGEMRAIKSDGTEFPVEFTSSIFIDANGNEKISSLMIDISDRKKHEQNLLSTSERYLNLSKTTFDAVWDWDVKTLHLHLGDGFEKLFGHHVDNNMGDFATWADNIHPGDKERVIISRLNKITHHDESTWKDEYRYMRADGSVAYVSDRGNLLRDSTSTYRMIGSMQDVTGLKEHEIAINDLNKELEKHASELALSNNELERFAYVASHDLQEPLRMVSSFLELLQKKYYNQLDETAIKYIDFAMDGADRMKKLILDLLEYSRISSFNQKLVLIDLNNLIINIKFSLKLVIDESNASVVVNPLPKIYGNESQIMQLFQNLISNALKYRNEQSPVVDIGFEDRDKEWLFYVKDNGIGIESKYFEKIFVIFQSLHNRNKYDGTGIGLAICKKIVELHGGRIWVESGNNNGTIFYFTIGKMLVNSPESK